MRLRTLSFLCVLVLLTAVLPGVSGGRAELCGALDKLTSDPGDGYVKRVLLTGSFTRLSALPERGKEILNAALQKTSLRLDVGKGFSALSLISGEEERLRLVSAEENGKEFLFVNGIGVENADRQIPYVREARLFDRGSVMSVLLSVPGILEKAQRLLPAEAETGKVREAMTYSHVGRVTGGAAYMLTAEEAGRFARDLAELLRGIPYLDAAAELIGHVSFPGYLTVTAKESEDGGVRVLEASGEILTDGRERSLSLMTAAGRNGVSVSLNAKAKEGKDQLRITGWLKADSADERTDRLNGTVELKLRIGEERLDLTGESALLCTTDRDGTEHLTGKVEWTGNTGKKDGTWIIKPDIAFTGDNGTGSVNIRHRIEETGDLNLDLSVSVSREKCGEADRAPAGNTEEGGLWAAEWELTRVLAQLIRELPPEDAYLMIHELCSEEWHTILPEQDNDDEWLVVD